MPAQGKDDGGNASTDSDTPSSPASSDSSEGTPIVLSLSNTFLPTAQLRSQSPNLILLTPDLVFFYVHSEVLQDASENGFNNFLPTYSPTNELDYPIVTVPEASSVLNILLHTIYGLDCAHYSPSFATLVKAVESMKTYGIAPKLTILPSTSLFALLLCHAPHAPLDLYSLAGHYDIFDLAVAASAHLLSFSLPRLTDAAAKRMGPIYLKRLFFLHLGRTEALKRALLPPPKTHRPTPGCSPQGQQALAREWALASARLAEDLRPDMSTYALELALQPLAAHFPCTLCQNALNARVQDLTAEWAAVKVRLSDVSLLFVRRN
ncbi:hypothetical protein C8F04DRAFT_1273416 [Mycena alexandri]|uniref:BTB domain-containing protein n=1 Tax=Mycena alexandri TaxID=1745969 RepID=A0AAD6S7J6_9AGAR|nr:hypothetical protein C8F04DRAFT_1273416 [Mycena alexandri]